MQLLMGGKPVNIRAEELPEWFVMHDHLRLTLPREAHRLLKLRSEIQLCQCIILGYTYLSIYGFLCRPLTSDQQITEWFMIGSIVACWIWRFKMYEYLATGVCVAWLFLVSNGRLLQAPPAEPSGTEVKNIDYKRIEFSTSKSMGTYLLYHPHPETRRAGRGNYFYFVLGLPARRTLREWPFPLSKGSTRAAISSTG